ncbi:hypothetical protein DND132_2912 [Pseudodesulfovibrio mercurii]|uniref:Lipoprotein n=1 Tax=Pseudodesulfovibrio mercurii TaxID=641491 RepID=F0JJL6_9BACT|nr:hypothetical protein [Pseudodesulfovibrio mercurii]EGB16115.1 hypothetical protein DND132_2912 [Pseudodesulfovibrio mercurii]
MFHTTKTFMSLAAAVLLCAALLAACAPKKHPAVIEPLEQVEFFDSASFDKQLSASLAGDYPAVTLVFPAAITLNSIPKRLDNWFSKVAEYGGSVKLVPVSQDKGVFSEVLSMLVAAYDYLKDIALYSPVEDYNALVFYQKGNGIIDKVVFERKEQTQSDN